MSYKFITVGLDENLKEAIDLLNKHKVERIISEEKSNNQISGFISQETVFDFFINNYYSTENIALFKLPLRELDANLVSKNFVLINSDETIISAIHKFWDYKISVLVVFETSENNIIGFIFLKDIFYLYSNSEKFSVRLLFN